MDLMDSGLAFHQHKLVYAWHAGRLGWLPYRYQKVIVHLWNPLACRIWGHDWIPDFDETGPPIKETDEAVWYDWNNVTHRECTACLAREEAYRGGVPEDEVE